MLCIVLNERRASGITAKNAKVQAQKITPQLGDVSVTKAESDGTYVVVFTNDLRGYAFGTWLNEHSVKHQVHVVKNQKALGQKLMELLPELASKMQSSRDPKAQQTREETIQMLSKAITDKRSPFKLS